MFNDLQKLKAIQLMVDAGTDHELIKQALELNHDVREVLDAAERQKHMMTTQQASEFITKALKGKVKGVFDTQKVNRLRKDGLLNPVDPRPSKREGYRFDNAEVERFVSEQLISKDELLQKQKVVEQKLVDSQKEVASLKRKIKTLEEKIKKQKDGSNV